MRPSTGSVIGPDGKETETPAGADGAEGDTDSGLPEVFTRVTVEVWD